MPEERREPDSKTAERQAEKKHPEDRKPVETDPKSVKEDMLEDDRFQSTDN
jgi:hypothetical protein